MAHDMWNDIETPGVSYFPQWTNQDTQSSRGIMRYNDNNAEGNLYFTSIDTHTTDDNLLHLCQIEYTTVSFALTITEDINYPYQTSNKAFDFLCFSKCIWKKAEWETLGLGMHA